MTKKTKDGPRTPAQTQGQNASPASGARMLQIASWAGVLIVIGAMTGLITSIQKQREDTVEASNAAPQPWQFNAVTNQHWDPRPGHVHWHAGPPPPPGQRGLDSNVADNAIATPAPVVTPIPAPGVEQPHTDNLPDSLRHPDQGMYDPVADENWDGTLGHVHWHSGPPVIGATNAVRIPEAWYYDAINDRHWDPDHRHWHGGLPPRDR